MRFLKKYFDFAILAFVVGGFVSVAAEGLATTPLPDTDESMMLQISYEMLNHGKLAFPMKRFYGGNIENAWHSLTPVAFVTLTGFLKLFGWGLTQGRVYNLITAVLMLLMLYLLARKLFSWQLGITAVVLIVSDPLFMARSRLLRYDLLAAAFALLAFYLYEKAEEGEGKWYYLGSGLAAGAGVMSHTNVLYILAVIAALMLFKDRWKLFRKGKLYAFAAGALAAMAYEIVFALVDYKNFLLQTRKDDVHFRVLEPMGWLNNLTTEPGRYVQWFEARGVRIDTATLLLHLFLLATLVAIVYLLARAAVHIKRGNAWVDPRVRVVIATVIIVLFFAIVTQRKVTQYVVHLVPWFALCVAILLRDVTVQIRRLSVMKWRWARPAYTAALVVIAIVIASYGYELVKQNRNYLTHVRNPDQASFEDLTTALRSVVPDGVCPASIASGYLWLVFPERDDCYFAYMEASLDEPLELEGKDYALIVKPKFEGRVSKLTGAGFERFHLLGELNRTPYGTLLVYYTGNDPRFTALAARRYYFFGHQRGYVSDEQLARSHEVWSASSAEFTWNPVELSQSFRSDDDDEAAPENGHRKGRWMEICSVDLDANSIYRVAADIVDQQEFDLGIIDGQTLFPVERISEGADSQQGFEGLFKTSRNGRVKIAVRVPQAKLVAGSPVSHISIRAIL
ncbi:MAG TPA: glycosyltransferase family 39 protein [Blastocatellia bacterium]|nr:glycosyltransferase family 39 protein [Blastocatellia bacterium]